MHKDFDCVNSAALTGKRDLQQTPLRKPKRLFRAGLIFINKLIYLVLNLFEDLHLVGVPVRVLGNECHVNVAALVVKKSVQTTTVH